MFSINETKLHSLDLVTGAIDAKNRDRGTGTNERPTKTQKKREAKTKGKRDISQQDDLNQMFKKEDAELRVSPSNKSGGSVKKRFAKTARLVGKVDTVEDFGDLNESKVKSERETGKKAHCLKKETGTNTGKRKIIKEKSVKQEKVVSEDKLENLDRLDKLDCRVNGHESGKASDEVDDVDAKIKKECKESKAKNGKIYSEANEDDDKETCTEEEGQQPEENENGIVRKHKTKAVKKVKVGTKPYTIILVVVLFLSAVCTACTTNKTNKQRRKSDIGRRLNLWCQTTVGFLGGKCLTELPKLFTYSLFSTALSVTSLYKPKVTKVTLYSATGEMILMVRLI